MAEAKRFFFICAGDSGQGSDELHGGKFTAAQPRIVKPEKLPDFLTIQADGVTLAVKLQPRAAANAIGEPMGAELRVKVTAPPVDAAANEALLRLLADTLDCPRGKVELVRGHTSRHKLIKLHGLAAGAVLDKLRAG